MIIGEAVVSAGVFILLSFFGYMIFAYLISLKKRTKDVTKSKLGVIDSTRVASKIVSNDVNKCLYDLDNALEETKLKAELRKEKAILDYQYQREKLYEEAKKFSKDGETPEQTMQRLMDELHEALNEPISGKRNDSNSSIQEKVPEKAKEDHISCSSSSIKDQNSFASSSTKSNYHYKRLNELSELRNNLKAQSNSLTSATDNNLSSHEEKKSYTKPRPYRKAKKHNSYDGFIDSLFDIDVEKFTNVQPQEIFSFDQVKLDDDFSKQRKNSQNDALRELNSGKNVFLTGGAGTGKSYVLREFVRNNCGKNILVTAPTGIAANNIEGSTLHRTFKLPLGIISDKIINNEDANRGAYRRNLLAHTDILIIDEISMCRADVFSYIVDLISDAQYVGFHIQVVLCGDFFQLPPVIGSSEKETFQRLFPDNVNGWCFLTEQWKKLNLTTCSLDKVYRQDNLEFVTALNQIRKGDPRGIDFINLYYCRQEMSSAVSLCGTNSLATEINLNNLGKIYSATYEYDIVKEGRVNNSDIRCEQHLSLKNGARVIILVNDSSGDLYQNGSFGTVVDIAPDRIKVCLDVSNRIVELPKYTWEIYGYELEGISGRIKKNVIGSYKQIPVRLGWAVTIHKSQGSTYEAVNLKSTRFWNYGQLYVALSRCKDVKKLYIQSALSKLNLKVSSEVKAFFND